MLAEMAREEGEEYEQVKQVDFRQLLKNLVQMVVAFLPWLIGALLFLAYGLKLERRLSYRFERGNDKVHSLYKAALDKASDAGFHRKLGQGRLSFAEQYQQQLPSLTPLTSAHLALKFGQDGRVAPDTKQLQADFANFHKELTQVAPLWRRVLGALNPISWYFNR